ncbi:MAG: hypothetical protein V4663_06795 [Bacteroidota bacterium]
MRLTLRSFALLDALSLLFMGMQVWEIATHYNELSSQLSEKVQAILMFPMFLLVIIGAIGLFLVKKFGLILYYIQFPFRLYLWVFSVGFITLLPEAFSVYEDKWFGILLKVCYMVEFIRLYLTIRIHFKYFK